jgi:hypothetical protein
MTQPSAAVKQELIRLLQKDGSRVGDVYRLSERGLNPDQVARELGVSTSGFVSNNRTVARALLEGHIPNGPSAAAQVASHLRRFAADRSLSDAAVLYLAERIERLGHASGEQPSRRPTAVHPTTPDRPPSSGSNSRPTDASLRALTEGELRARTRALVDAIRDAEGIVADDYLRVATTRSPLDELAALVSSHMAGRTFASLSKVRRLDLSLEAHAVAWADDLPLRADMVEAARARLVYYGFESEEDRS